jgi:hypothetical protein
MIYPYARITPMHLGIMPALLFPPFAIPFFLLLKTYTDCIMHIMEHNLFLEDKSKRL